MPVSYAVRGLTARELGLGVCNGGFAILWRRYMLFRLFDAEGFVAVNCERFGCQSVGRRYCNTVVRYPFAVGSLDTHPSSLKPPHRLLSHRLLFVLDKNGASSTKT